MRIPRRVNTLWDLLPHPTTSTEISILFKASIISLESNRSPAKIAATSLTPATMMVTAKILSTVHATIRPAESEWPILVHFLVTAIELDLELLLQLIGVVYVDLAPPELVISRTGIPGDDFEIAFVVAAIFAGAVGVNPGRGHV